MFYVLLLFENSCKDVYLPDLANWSGSILLTSGETRWKQDVSIPVRVLDGNGYIACPAGFSWEDKAIRAKEVPIRNRLGVIISKNSMQIKIQFIASKLNDTVFKKYLLPKEGRVDIGRDTGCTIVLADSTISSHHCVIKIDKGGYYLEDKSSHMASFVNGMGMRDGNIRLQSGDIITLPSGYKIVFLGSIIAINNHSHIQSVKLNPAAMRVDVQAQLSEDRPLPEMIRYHHRMVRVVDRRDEEQIEIEAPISKNEHNEPPLLLTLGPSMTMILPMGLSILVQGRAWTGLIMIGGSSILAVMWGFINARYRRKTERETETKRRNIYVKYIAEMDELLRGKYEKEYTRLMHNNPSVGQCAIIPGDNTRRLWERMPSHSDFATVRLGKGDVPLSNPMQVPKEKLSMIDDPLRDDMKNLVANYECIKGAPVTLNLRENPIVGILGTEVAKGVAESIVLQLAALHNYHDLRICIICTEETGSEWRWARWLPHVFSSEDRQLRMVVSKPQAIQAVFAHLDEVMGMRLEDLREKQQEDNEEGISEALLPHYVLLCTDPRLIESKPLIKSVISSQLGFTLLLMATGIEQLPKECKMMIDTDSGNLLTADGDFTKVELEYSNRELLEQFASSIAPIRVKASVEDAAIPTLVTFLEIYGVKRVEDLDVWRFWNENKAYDGLKSVIGYSSGSKPFILDISDKAHGPHGLVAGTTGSGKSVMLETYILSLALNYSPDMVRFILIDYKGGGMADTFKDLPHVTGIIDNLQGERVIQRALASLEGEIHRRERIFKDAGVNNIHDYMRFYGEDIGEEKLPHLIVIVDEFAELKNEQPEFMAKLVSASRVGRSLGLHLILATQKPSGSVSPEIEANTNFRICLRVQSRGDSMDMLHRPEAAYIKGKGRCYVKVGNDEIFEQVQTSYSGIDYNPNERDTRFDPKLLDDAGQIINLKKKHAKTKAKVDTEMDAVLKLIAKTVEDHHVQKKHMLWQPVLNKMIHFDELDDYKNACFHSGIWKPMPENIIIPIGLADDVANQQYLTAWVDISSARNIMICGLAGSGKTTMVQSMVYALTGMYSPERVHIYIMSLSSRTLVGLKEFPHVGDIVFDGEEHELYRMLDLLRRESEERKERFEKAYVNGFVEYNRAQAQKNAPCEPAIVVFIDRMQQIRDAIENDEEAYARLFELIREGSSRGIYFVITSMGGNEIPFKLRDAFLGIALQLHDRGDYSDTIGVRVPIEMEGIAPDPGRGMIAIDGVPYEFQVALGGHAQTDSERAEQLSVLANEMQTTWTGEAVQGIARIPEDPTYEQFSAVSGYEEAASDIMKLPLAYSLNSGMARVIDLQTEFSFLVTGGRKTGKTNALMCIARGFVLKGADIYIIASDEWKAFATQIGARRLNPRTEECIQEIVRVSREEIHKRFIQLSEASNKAETRAIAASHKPIVFIIDDLDSYMDISKYTEFHKELERLGNFCSAAASCALYTFASAASGGLVMNSRQAPIAQLIDQGRGIVMGGKLGEADVWNLPSNVISYRQKNAALPKGTGYLITEESLEQVVFPLLVEK